MPDPVRQVLALRPGRGVRQEPCPRLGQRRLPRVRGVMNRPRSMQFHPVSHSICVHGAPGPIRSAAASLGIPVMSNPRERRGGVLVQDARAGDLLAYLEGQGRSFELVDEVRQ